MAERRPEVRSIEPPGLLSKLWGKTLDAFGVSNDFQEDSTSWRDAVRNSANYISPYNVGHGGNLEPQTPRAATDFIDANKGMMERMGRAEPEPLDGLMAFGLSSGVGGLGRRVEQRAVGAAEPKPAMAFANADEKAALAAGAGAQPIRAYRGFTDGNLAPGPRDGEISPKFWASSSPDVASSYALDPAHEYRRWSPTGAVAPLDIDFKNPLTVDARGRPWNSIPWEDGPTTTFKLSKHAQGLGYDGLVIKNVQDSLRSEAPLSDTYAALQPNTVRSATTGETLFSNGDEKAGAALGAFGESSNPQVRAAQSRAQNVPFDEKLAVQHNLSGKNFLHNRTNYNDNIPVPSLAITKAGEPLTNFGDISLFGSPEMAIPKGSNPVYPGDAYTARAPKIVRDVPKSADADRLYEKLTGEKGKGYKLNLDDPFWDDGFKLGYLRSKGQEPPPGVNAEDWARETFGYKDRNGLEDFVGNWLGAHQGIIRERIYKGFNDRMERREYAPHTLENMVKASKGKHGSEGFNYGPTSWKAAIMQPFKSLMDIQENRGLIRRVPKEELDAQKSALGDDGFRLANALGYRDTDPDMIWEGLRSKDPEIQQQAQALRSGLHDLPTEYFEAKPQRAVDTGEFKMAGVPEGMTDVAEHLKRRGLDVRMLPGDEVQRAAALTEMLRTRPDLLFSNADEKAGAFAAAASNLPMDQASRLARAKEMGFDTERTWYHGSTHDINAFDPSRGNAEGHLGAGSYFTTSPKDAGVNYGPSGVDLTNRIERLAERLSGDTDMDMDAARAQARLQIAGSSDGAIYPTFLRGKTLDLRNSTRGNPTALEVQYRHNESDFMDAARGELGPDADKWDLYDRARELADEASVDFEPKGELWNFAQSIRSQADQYGFDADEVIASLDDYMAEGVGPADGIDRALRGSPLMYAEHPETGALIGNDVIRQAFSDAGYPNIMMDAKSAFPRMPNIDDGTLHMVVSDPKNIRSVNAAFDPSKSDSAYLLAANADEKAAAFAAAAGEPKGITAYHGSPHDFDKFSLDKIGTGEGAQAYGHGLYFADNEGVAKSYRDALKGKVLNIDGLPKGRAEAADELASRIQQAIPTAKQPYNAAQMLSGWLADGLQPDQMKARIASGAWPDDMKAELYAVTDKIAESASPNPGKMYQVRINADPESFLDWDKPLSQQTKAGEIWNNYLGQKPEYADPAKVGSQFANPTGKELYSAIFEDVPGMGVPARSAVTEKLKEQGLSGIRYLDGQSRADGAGSSNYVVFDDSLIEILKKYGMAGGALGAGALLQSGDAGATPFGASSQTLIPPLMEQSLGAFGQPDDDQD